MPEYSVMLTGRIQKEFAITAKNEEEAGEIANSLFEVDDVEDVQIEEV